MKIKTQYYAIFVKINGKWIGPYCEIIFTKEDIIYDSGLEDENASYKKHLESYLKRLRKYLKKPIKLVRQVWE